MAEHINVEFRGSFPNEASCPKDDRPEYALIGRSNVGKSSLINSILGRREIARTSKKPGKTQLINYYLVNHEWYIVDLPGYGYAKVSKSKREAWRKMIEGYLIKRDNLQCAMVLIDSNISPQERDINFINQLGEYRVPFVLVYTKADRLKPEELQVNIENFQQALLEYWHSLPQQFITSANENRGRDEILKFIEEINAQVQ